MYLSINIVRAIVEELMRQGLAFDVICARIGLDATELADASHRLPIERSTQVVAAATEISANDALGLRVGESAPMKALHVVGHLLTSCTTMREAVQLFMRYSKLVFEGAGFRLVEEDERARFIYEHPYAGSRFERFASEIALTVMMRMGLQLTGDDKHASEARFRHAAPHYLGEYQRIFRCPVAFGQSANELIFERRLLDLPQLHGDDPLCELLRERADHLLAHTQATERLAERIVEVIKLQLELGTADPARLAHRLGMTVRSLQRRLRESSLSLTQLVDGARREIACASLRVREVPIKDIAHRLGFSEPSAFYRAFKRWTGMTPAQFRERGTLRS